MLQLPRRHPRNTSLFRVVITLVVLGSIVTISAYGPARTYRRVAAALQTRKPAQQPSTPQPTISQTNPGRIRPKSLQANGKIAFTSFRDGNNEIYAMNADGTGQTNLTNNSASDITPAFSPDGSKLAFASDRDGNFEIYVMNADGSSQTRLTNNAAEDVELNFSPDGSKIAFRSNRDGNYEIYVMDADGSNQTRLTNNPAEDSEPFFSPDVSKIAFTSQRDGNFEIYLMNADGTGQTNLTNNAADDLRPAYSPDGSKIAFISNRDGNYEIYVMNTDGTGQTRLTNNAAFDEDPKFSPDGSKIAFISNRDGNYEIYVMNPDGSSQVRLTNNSADDVSPDWQKLLNCTPPPPNLVIWFPLDGTTDDMLNSLHAVLHGSSGGFQFDQGEVNQGGRFFGAAFTFLQVDDTPALNPTSEITIDAWIKLTNTNDARIVDKMPTATTDGYSLDVSGGHLRFRVNNQQATSAQTLPIDTFLHVAGTYDGAQIRVYINGTQVGSAALTGAIPTNSLPLRFGADSDGGSNLNGLIDEIELFDRALAQTELKNIYDAKSAGKCHSNGTSTITVSNTNDNGPGSLRQAILDANASPGTQTIAFNIAGAGVHTISPTSALPDITQPVIIDGYTQPGATVNTQAVGNNAVLLIELDGTNTPGGTYGLVIIGGSTTVRGLVINRFKDNGIVLDTSGGNTIIGNFIGTNPAGDTASANQNNGVIVRAGSANNTIGGTTPAARNIVSGNGNRGIVLTGTGTNNNIVQGNYLGTNAAGTVAIANGDGLDISSGAQNNTVGGTTAAARNVISGNGINIILFNNASNNTLQGNYIGTDANGTTAVNNTSLGIAISFGASANTIGGTAAGAGNLISGNNAGLFITDSGTNNIVVQGNLIGTTATGNAALPNAIGVIITGSSQNNTIGGAAAGAGNVIAFNNDDGVSISSGTGNSVRANAIHDNGTTATQLGIDLGPDGVTPNDAGDPDTGANNLQNFPVLTSAVTSGGNTTIQGTLNSTTNTQFTIEFFANPACDASGNGEGQTFLGSTLVTTDASGNATINTSLAVNVPAGQAVTATATDPNNNTSEFSACQTVTTLSATDVSWINASGGNWNNAANWQDGTGMNRVPIAGDNVFITLPGTYTVTLDVSPSINSLTVGGATGTQTFDENVRGLTLATTSTVGTHGSFTQSGTLGGAGDLNISGRLNYRGTMAGTGTTNVLAGATFVLDGAQPQLLRPLNNATTAQYNVTSSMVLGTNGTFNNQAGALFDVLADKQLFTAGGSGVFNNAGTFRKATATGTLDVNVQFNNSGTVDLQAGTLNLNTNGTSSGAFNGAAGTTLLLSAQNLQAASSVNAPTVNLSSTATIAGTFNVTGTTTVAGTSTFTGNVQNVGTTLTVNGSAIFNSNAVTVATINLNGTIDGSADVSPTATGTLNFNGILDGTGTTNVPAGATLNLGGSQPQLKRVLNNAGTANYSPTSNMVFVGGTLNNQTGATFNVQSDTQIFQSGGTNAFNNAGTVRKTTGASEANFNLPFTNTGTVEVQTGTIRFGNSYTQTAGLTFLNGGNFASNSTMSVQGGELRGAGTISGNLSNGGTLNPGTSPGCLNVTGNYTQTSGGTLNIEIGGTSACTQFDQLNITGSATLNGTLSISLVNSFSPSAGQSFQIATYASHTGTFASVTGPLPATVNATNVTVMSPSSFQISGHVQDSGGNALSGSAINLTGSQSASTTTDGSGNYTFASLAANGNYTVTPSNSCYTFAPTNRVFNNLSANQTGDFTSTLTTYTISGRIADALNNPVSGLTLNLTGSQTANTTTDANGNYTFATVGCGGNYTITPAASNFEFNPANAQFNNLSANQMADFTATPSVFTPTGNNVSVTAGDFNVTYATVSVSGRTRATPINPTSAGSPPANMTIVTNAPAADLSTTATFAGTITVCTNVNSVNDLATFSTLKMLHREGASLVDRTSSVDFPSRTVCGQVASLSPFVIGRALPSGTQAITGRIVDGSNHALAGVTLTLSDANNETKLATTVTTTSGNYSFNAPNGGDYRITPSKINVIFTPSAHNFLNLSAAQTGNFNATTAVNITGQLLDDTNHGVAGVTMILSGTVTRQTLTLPGGHYLFTDLPPGGTYTVKPEDNVRLYNPSRTDVPPTQSTGNTNANFNGSPNPNPTPTPTITGDFAGPTPDPRIFSGGLLTQIPGSTDPLVTVGQQNGKLLITPRTNTTGESFNGIVTVDAVDFTNASASVEVDQTCDNGAQTSFGIGADERNYFRFIAQDVEPNPSQTSSKRGNNSPQAAPTLRQLIFQVRQAGVLQAVSGAGRVALDPQQMRFWRFRHDAPTRTMFFETSPTGVDGTWTVRGSFVLPGAVGALAAELSAGTAGVVASPGQAIFDNLLIRPATQPFRVGTFRLANTVFRLNEGVSKFDLTVERTGDTNSISAVTFATDPFDGRPCATSDGKARARCDYQTSIGRLVFAAGETTKSVTFFITDDSYVEGDETFRVALANPSENWGITDPRFATVTIVDNDQGPVANGGQKAQAHAPAATQQPNPVNTAAFFVRQQYLDFLEREPEPLGFNAWMNVLNNCAYQGFPGPGKTGSDPSCDRITVSGAFFGSPEFQQKGFFVYRFYKASLPDLFTGSLAGRQPTYEEFLTDLNSVSGGQTTAEVNARKDAFTDAWLDRPDFRTLYEGLSDADFVDKLALTANVTLSNREQLINDLATHSSDSLAYRQAHARVLRAIVENGTLYNREFNAAFVEMQYFGYLQRDPDPAGYDAWLNYLDNTGDFRTMINGFVYSFEYQSRFGTP